MKNKKWLKRIVIFLFIVIVISAWYERPVTEHISISSEGKIGKPVKFALITDLHSGYYGENQADLIYRIDKENVDAILLSGDIFDDRLSMDNAEIFCKQIADAYPCYYVTGNHELWSGKEEEIKEKLRTYGVVVLEGNSETISLNGNNIDIGGVDDPTIMPAEEWERQIREAENETNQDNFKILLSHRPERVDTYKQHSFDLVVCGHAHGGQWKIPFTQTGFVAPNQGLFPRYVDGLYELDNGTKMVVSRGLARERMPYPRFFNHPEIVIITID